MKMKNAVLMVFGVFLLCYASISEAALIAPTLSATAVSGSQINLSWADSNKNRSGYAIERSLSSTSGFTQIATVGSKVRTYSNIGLAAGTTYYYKVKVYTSKEFAYSNVASATTSVTTADVTPPTVSITSPASGTTYTTAQTVSIAATAADNVGVSKVEFYENGVLRSTDTASPYSHAWSFSSANNGSHSWTAKAYDAAGNATTSAAVSLTVNIATSTDTTPPAGSVTVSSGAAYTNSTAVTLGLSAADASGVSQMCVSNSTTCSAWEPYATTKAWTLPAGDGTKTVYVWFKDSLGNANSTPYSDGILLDTVSPQCAVTINNGAAYTNSASVTLSLSATDPSPASGLAQMCVSNSNASCTSWVTYGTSMAWTLPTGDGTKTVYAWFKDNAGNQTSTPSVVSDAITLDTAPPTAAITSPTAGTTYTSAQTVAIAASASDTIGVSKVEFYQNGVLRSTDTTSPYSHSWSFTSADNGSHSWSAKSYDTAGNATTSTAVSLGVNIPTGDTTPPTVSITSPANGTTFTTAQTVAIASSASDNIGVSKVEFYQNGVLRSTDTTSPYSHSWSFTSADNGSSSWTAKAYDAAGNATTSAAVSLGVNIATAGAGAHLWSLQFGGPATTDIATGQGTAIDPWGDVFVTAVVRGSVDFGDGPKTGNGVVLAKYSVSGDILWSRLWIRQGTAECYPRGLIVNADGSVVVSGYFYGTVDFGGTTLTSVGGYDLFMVKYSGSGQYQWVQRFGAAGSEVPNAMAVDASGNLFLAGYVQGSATLGGTTFASVSGSRDAFVAKYSPAGVHLWSKSFGGTSTDSALGVAVDSVGNPWITGSFQGTVDFGTGPLTSAGLTDIFVVGFYADGGIATSWREGGASRDEGRGIAFDGSGNLVLAAYFEGTANFGGQTLTSAGAVDVLLAQYSPAGTFRWVRKFGGGYNDNVNGLSVNEMGDIAITGTFMSWIDMGGAFLTGNGSTDVFIAKYSSSGNRIWSRGSNVQWDDYGNGVAIDDGGQVVATGSFYEGIDLGGGLLSTLVGSTDGYLARFAP